MELNINISKDNLGMGCFKNCEDRNNHNSLYYQQRTRSNEIDPKYHEMIVVECLEIAKRAKFKTDYDDVYQHLFGGNYHLTFLKSANKILGFAVFDCIEINKEQVLHLHGIIMHPSAQRYGNTRTILIDKINEIKPDYITLKTHNPRMYYVASSLALNNGNIYPNFTDKVPNDIIEIARQNPFISNCNDNLIVENAYEDEKIQQDVKDNKIITEFAALGQKDAQVIIVKLK